MTITNVQIQLITLLSTIIAIIAGLLSITQYFRKNGVLQSILALCLCILPVLFIQQIIQITVEWHWIISFGAAIIAGITAIIIRLKHLKTIDTFNFVLETLILCGIIYTGHLAFPVEGLDSEKLTYFLTNLNSFKISVDMYKFLAQNLFYTIAVFLDFIHIALTFYLLGQIVSWASVLNDREKFYWINPKKLVVVFLFTTFISFGWQWPVENTIFNLF